LFLPKSAKKVEKTLDFFRKSCRIDTVVIDIDTEIKMITILSVVLSAFLVLVLIGGAVSGSIKTLG